MHRSISALLLLCFTLAGCASGGAGGARAPGGTDVLRADEIRRSGAADLPSAIRMLRPAFLRTRGRTSMVRSEETEPAVYLDDRLMGGLAVLADIQIASVIEVRYFTASQAQMKWGNEGHSAGAILVLTGSRR